MKLVWPSAKLLQAAAGASLRTYHCITRSILPLLLEQYTKHTQVRGTHWLHRAWGQQDVEEDVLPWLWGEIPWASCGLEVLG